MIQRQEVYDDLNNALRVMNIINDQTPTSNAFYAMWLLENKQLRLGLNINVSILPRIFVFDGCLADISIDSFVHDVFFCVAESL